MEQIERFPLVFIDKWIAKSQGYGCLWFCTSFPCLCMFRPKNVSFVHFQIALRWFLLKAWRLMWVDTAGDFSEVLQGCFWDMDGGIRAKGSCKGVSKSPRIYQANKLENVFNLDVTYSIGFHYVEKSLFWHYSNERALPPLLSITILKEKANAVTCLPLCAVRMSECQRLFQAWCVKWSHSADRLRTWQRWDWPSLSSLDELTGRWVTVLYAIFAKPSSYY